MTDNEKAASFIGWKPETPCSTGEYDPQEAYGHRYYCVPCDLPNMPSRAHFRAAPDMNDPRNYMKALDLRNEHGARSISLTHAWSDEGWVCEIYRDFGRANIKSPSCATSGDAVVKALAALYDAEHPASEDDRQH